MGKRKKRKTSQTRRRTTIHDLPDECLALVFPFLKSRADRNAASLTCRRWRALDALSRHSLHFACSKEDKWHYLHQHLLHALKIFPNVLSLGVHCFINGLFFPMLSRLQSVEFSESSSVIDDAFVQSVAQCCPALKHFSIELRFSSIKMCNVSDVGLCALAHGCRHLTSVKVPYCYTTDNGIDTLLTMCPDMEALSVAENYDICGWGFRHGKRLRRLDMVSCCLSDDSFIETLQVATGLETLELGYVTLAIEALGEGCPTLASIGTYCKLLVELELSWWSAVDDFSLQAIARGCLNLKVLEAESCDDVTFLGWQAVAVSCLKLEHLNVARCAQFYDDSLFAIYKGCPSLTHLSISHSFVPPNRIFRRFQMFRRSVDVTFSDEEGKYYRLVLT